MIQLPTDSSRPLFLFGHVIDVINELPDESIDCVVTSPPYYGLRSYGTEPVVWDGDPACQHKWGDEKKVKGAYGLNKDFNARWSGYEGNGKKQEDCKPKEISLGNTCVHCGAWKGELGHELTPQLFVEHLVSIFEALRPALKDTGTLWVNLGDSYSGSGGAGGDYNPGGIKEGQPKYKPPQSNIPAKSRIGVPWRFALAMIDRGWILRQDIIWKKPACMPDSVKDRFTRDFEYIFFFVKNEKYYFEQQFEPLAKATKQRAKYHWCKKDNKASGYQEMNGLNRDEKYPINEKGRNMRSIWEINTESYSGSHYAVFPPSIPRRCISAGCPPNGIVLDPFGGSGTTAMVAQELGVRCILIDIDERNEKLMRQRTHTDSENVNRWF